MRLFLIVLEGRPVEFGGIEHDVAHAIYAVAIVDYLLRGEEISKVRIDREAVAARSRATAPGRVRFELFGRQREIFTGR